MDNQFGETNFQQPNTPEALNAYDLDAEYSLGLIDVPHKLTISPIVELPFGEGKRWATGGVGGDPGRLDGLVDCFARERISNRHRLEHEQHEPVYPDAAGECDGSPTRARRGTATRVSSVSGWTRPVTPCRSAFTLGTGPRTDGSVRGPHRNNWDFAAAKNVPLGGRARGEFRVEVINLTNTVKVIGPIHTAGSSGFGQIRTQSGFMRMTQFTFRWRSSEASSRRLDGVTIIASRGGLWSTVALAATVGVALTAAQAPPSAAPQAPTFRVDVTLVTTDVIPRDAGGRFVSDLTARRLHHPRGRRAADDRVVLAGPWRPDVQPADPGGGPVARPKASSCRAQRSPMATDTAGRVFLVFVDDLHFEPELHAARAPARADARDHAAARRRPGRHGVERAVVHRDRADLRSQARCLRRCRRFAASGITAAEIFQMLETSQGPADIRQPRADGLLHAPTTFSASSSKVRNKRKAVIYISTGYDFDPFAAGAQGRDRIQGGRFSEPTRFLIDEENPYFRLPTVTADIDLCTYMRELTLSANRANATIFTVDPRGLSGVVDAGQYLDQSEWRTLPAEDAELAALPGRRDRRLRGGQRQRLRRPRSSGSTRRRATTT